LLMGMLALSIGLLSVVLWIPLFAQDDGAAWLKRIDNAERIPHSYGVVKQTITTSGGSERTLTMSAWSDQNGDRSLMVYTAPPRVKGDKILQRDGGDNIWYYMKRRDVTRHFVGHTRRQKAMGSDFTYEDLAQGSLTEDYTAELMGSGEIDGTNCVKLKLIPTESGPSYDHLILWAGEDDALSRQIEYYDEEGHLKTLYLTDFRTVEGRKFTSRMEMNNHREDSRTVMEYESITFAKKPDGWIFTRDALTREIK